MDSRLVQQTSMLEDRHWWHEGRRRVLESVLKALNLPASAAVLDVGCGSGGNLALLARFGRLVAIEPDTWSRGMAAARGLCEVDAGALPDDVPFGHGSFDLITVLDVLEHVEDEAGSLEKLNALLKEGGRLLVTVPAFEFLWSRHDEVHHHFRRHTRASLARALRSAGLSVQYTSYFNTILFPAVAGVRIPGRLLRLRTGSDLTLPAASVNRLLTAIFGAERHLLPRLSLPFGVSVIAVAAKTAR